MFGFDQTAMGNDDGFGFNIDKEQEKRREAVVDQMFSQRSMQINYDHMKEFIESSQEVIDLYTEFVMKQEGKM